MEKGNIMFFENGKSFPRYSNEVKMLIGKKIKYLRDCDIDKSGRGYFFPQLGTIMEVKGKNVRIDYGTWEYFPNIREYEETD
jgi:hypothetical protein